MMKNKTVKGGFKSGHGYRRQNWNEVSDNPGWDESSFKLAKPFRDVFPEIAAKMEKKLGGRPKKENPKQAVPKTLDEGAFLQQHSRKYVYFR
ncbi:MAG: hypothetical protein V6Z86_09645 [Hyphomicrobiales bacterium]